MGLQADIGVDSNLKLDSKTGKAMAKRNKENYNLKDSQVFIVDTIGFLSKIYSYANIAYVGGAKGTTGLHNILEPAVFGVPIITRHTNLHTLHVSQAFLHSPERISC